MVAVTKRVVSSNLRSVATRELETLKLESRLSLRLLDRIQSGLDPPAVVHGHLREQNKPYTESMNPVSTQHKPKVLMKQSKDIFMSFLLFFSFFLFSVFFSKKMKASQSMVWMYGFFSPEGASHTPHSKANTTRVSSRLFTPPYPSPRGNPNTHTPTHTHLPQWAPTLVNLIHTPSRAPMHVQP